MVSGGVATTGIVASILNPVSGGNSKIHFSDNATYNWTAGTVGNAFAITPTEASNSAGTPALFINSSGNCGVGTSSPNAALTVHGSAGNAKIRLGQGGDHTIIGPDASGHTIINAGTSGGTMNFETAGSERMRIDSSGRVGIGTTSPSQLLTVAGVARFENFIEFAGSISTPGTAAAIYRPADNNLAFSTASTERMRISSDGDLFIGGTSDANADFVFDRGSRASFYRTLYFGGATSAAATIELNTNGTATFTADASINSLTIGRGAGNVATNTAIGDDVLNANTSGAHNTGVGVQVLLFNTTGSFNTGTGKGSLALNTTGGYNVANGYAALNANTTGNSNTAIGNEALKTNTTGSNNTANGYSSLYNNTTGYSNVAIGNRALYSSTTGIYNTSVGELALYANTTGDSNTATGWNALYNNTSGTNNVAVGRQALYDNTTGLYNVAVGRHALNNNTTGSGNIGLGFMNHGGSYTPVFNPTTESNRLILGHTSISNAYVKVAWTVTSDERDKMNFAPVPHGLDFVNQLKPTAYQFKVDRDTEEPNGDVRYGFKAQDILALEGDNPVIIDTEDADHLKYKGEHLVPVLVNAVQELSTMVKELQAEIKTLKG